MSIYVGAGSINYPAMRGPCPYGYHVPSDSEWGSVVSAGVALGAWTSSGGDNFRIKMKIPFAGFRSNGGSVTSQGSIGEYHSCKANTTTTTQVFRITSTTMSYGYGLERRLGLCVRPFKDDPVIPTSSWTTIYDGSSVATGAGIFWNSSSGLISISKDGTTWYTIADKNLGATTVYNDGDTLSEANCGKYFQFGNNYPFPRTGSVTTGSAVDASAYGPGNWYYSNIFRTSANPRDTSVNRNLRGGVVGAVKADVKDICVGAGVDDYSPMQGPCPDGFHVAHSSGTISRYSVYRRGVTLGAWTSSGGSNFSTYLKLPMAGYRSGTSSTGSKQNSGSTGRYWTSTSSSSTVYGYVGFTSTSLSTSYGNSTPNPGHSIRPFKDEPVVPDSTWTTLYDGSGTASGAGIFWNKGLGLISISANGTNWITMADKNLGAKVVRNSGDTVSEDNCGGNFQRGNNYMFPYSGNLSGSTAQVDVSGFGPGNYYNDSQRRYGSSSWTQQWDNDLRGAQTVSPAPPLKGNVKQAYVGTTIARPTYNPGIYWNKSKGLISISSDGKNWITMADKNLGAKVVYNDGDTLSQDNCGYYYQWGNNYGFAWTGSVSNTTTKVNASTYGPTNPYYGSTFIKVSSSPYDRSSVQNDNLWGNTTNTLEARQGPCPTGRHIPLTAEFQSLEDMGVALGAWTGSGGDSFRVKMKMPFAGSRLNDTTNVYQQGTYGDYRASTPSGTIAGQMLQFYANGLAPGSSVNRARGQSIRAFKNEPVVPDNSRAVLYQPS